MSGAPAARTDDRPRSYRADPQVPPFPDDKPLIVFDGDCVLCSGSARFVMRHDPARRFRLAAAQSALGRSLYRHYGLDPVDYDTILLIADGRLRVRSEAALGIARGLGPPWSLAALLAGVPRPLRDAVYDIVARHRFRLFGRRATCFRPASTEADRFLS